MKHLCRNQLGIRRACAVVGACLLMAPNMIHFIWGNLSTYVLSYVRRHSPSVSSAEASWASSLFLAILSLIFPLSSYLIRIIGRKKTALLGIILFNAGVFVCYFAIETSMFLINLMLGVVSGVGGGFIFGVATDYGVQWSSKEGFGFILPAIYNSYTVLAIVVNQLITTLVNPLNEPPLVVTKDFVFFAQTDVLERVPSLFYILGLSFLTCQMIGLFLVSDCPLSTPVSPNSSALSSMKEDNENRELKSSMKSVSEDVYDETDDTEGNNLTPRQMVSTASFHFLWMPFTLGQYTFIMVAVHYKAFGQLWISDDHLLTLLGTAFVIIDAFTKMATGILMDTFGVKNTMMATYAIIAVCASFLYLSPQIDIWLYFLLVIVLIATSSFAFLANTVAPIALYGRRHAVVNAGLVNLTNIPMMFVAPLIMGLMMTWMSWAGVFYAGAVMGVSALLLVTIGLPRR